MQFDQNRWPVDHLECRSAKHLADGNKTQLVASSHGRCSVEKANKAFPALQSKSTSVWCKTKHKTVESRDPEARRVAETSGNSRWTQTRMITECSNGDVQVLRTVKNGVSTAVQLIARKYSSLNISLHSCYSQSSVLQLSWCASPDDNPTQLQIEHTLRYRVGKKIITYP